MQPPSPAFRPAFRDGVAPSLLYLPARSTHALLLDQLAAAFPHVSRAQWRQRMARGEVLDPHHRACKMDAPTPSGGWVWYFRLPENEVQIPFQEEILYQDDLIVVADKPHFLPVTPGGRHARETLLSRLQAQLQCPSLAPLHRLDRETAGLLLFSRQTETRNAYLALFRQQQIYKQYEAVAAHKPALQLPLTHQSRLVEHPVQFFRMAEQAGVPNSRTTISAAQPLANGKALYRLIPHSGKRHQLRVHMQALGVPIAGDQFYPSVLRGPDEPEDFSQPLQLLARSLAFTDPLTGEQRQFVSRRQLALATADTP